MQCSEKNPKHIFYKPSSIVLSCIAFPEKFFQGPAELIWYLLEVLYIFHFHILL